MTSLLSVVKKKKTITKTTQHNTEHIVHVVSIKCSVLKETTFTVYL